MIREPYEQAASAAWGKGKIKMNESNRNRDFVGYEYRDITVGRSLEALYVDDYQNFGWEFQEKPGFTTGITSSTLRFKRNRKIINKAELTRLQRQFDSYAKEIEELERSKASSASIAAISIGIIGTAFMAGSVFAVTATPMNILLSVIFAVPGFIGWLLPYFVYKSMYAKRTRKVEQLIDEKYDEIYEACEKASRLLPK